MKRIGILAVLLGLGAGACGGGAAGPIDALHESCKKCSDKACYDELKKQEEAVEKELEAKYPKKEDAPAELVKAYESYRECRRALRDKVSP